MNCSLVTYQRERLFKEGGIFAGLTFTCSKVNYKVVSGDMESELLENVSFLFKTWLLAWFIAIYWAVFKLECELPHWEEKITALEIGFRHLLIVKRYRVGK